MGSSTATRIVVLGPDLVEDIIGKVSLGDMAFLELKGRLPTSQESTVFNALAVTLVEHGMTPSAIASPPTYLGHPDSLQGAVAGGRGCSESATASAARSKRPPALCRRRWAGRPRTHPTWKAWLGRSSPHIR